jgi:hypothetical protein
MNVDSSPRSKSGLAVASWSANSFSTSIGWGLVIALFSFD